MFFRSSCFIFFLVYLYWLACWLWIGIKNPCVLFSNRLPPLEKRVFSLK